LDFLSRITRSFDNPPRPRYGFPMSTVQEIQRDVMALPAGERARLAHEILLSLEDASAYGLSPTQEAEIQRRLLHVREGSASGRPATEVLGDIRAKYT
jgi:putative addiction module component (TIGR02574 family)